MNPPFHIPLAVKIGEREQLLHVRKSEERFTFTGLKQRPVPSLLRRFSAPVILNYPYTEADLLQRGTGPDGPIGWVGRPGRGRAAGG